MEVILRLLPLLAVLAAYIALYFALDASGRRLVDNLLVGVGLGHIALGLAKTLGVL